MYHKAHKINRRGGRHDFGIMFGMSKGWESKRPSGRICQYIGGEPSGDDACKCGHQAQPDRPYCADHMMVCYAGQPEPKKGTDDVGHQSIGAAEPKPLPSGL